MTTEIYFDKYGIEKFNTDTGIVSVWTLLDY